MNVNITPKELQLIQFAHFLNIHPLFIAKEWHGEPKESEEKIEADFIFDTSEKIEKYNIKGL